MHMHNIKTCIFIYIARHGPCGLSGGEQAVGKLGTTCICIAFVLVRSLYYKPSVKIGIFTYIYMYIYIAIHTYTHISIYVYIYLSIYIYISIYLYTHIYISIYLYLYLYIYTFGMANPPGSAHADFLAVNRLSVNYILHAYA